MPNLKCFPSLQAANPFCVNKISIVDTRNFEAFKTASRNLPQPRQTVKIPLVNVVEGCGIKIIHSWNKLLPVWNGQSWWQQCILHALILLRCPKQ